MGLERKRNNYLERRPLRSADIVWQTDESGVVTLQIENRGFWNRAAQIFFGKPRVSLVKLDELGSFVWPLADGEHSLLKLGEAVSLQFGERAEPLYDRLISFFQTLESYRLIFWM